MLLKDRIAETALSLVDVPWKSHGRSLAGLDCVGLVIFCARAHGLDMPDFRQYGIAPSKIQVLRELRLRGDPIALRYAEAGDVLAMVTDRERHLGVITERGLVHVSEEHGRVVLRRSNLELIRTQHRATAWRYRGNV